MPTTHCGEIPVKAWDGGEEVRVWCARHWDRDVDIIPLCRASEVLAADPLLVSHHPAGGWLVSHDRAGRQHCKQWQQPENAAPDMAQPLPNSCRCAALTCCTSLQVSSDHAQ